MSLVQSGPPTGRPANLRPPLDGLTFFLRGLYEAYSGAVEPRFSEAVILCSPTSLGTPRAPLY